MSLLGLLQNHWGLNTCVTSPKRWLRCLGNSSLAVEVSSLVLRKSFQHPLQFRFPAWGSPSPKRLLLHMQLYTTAGCADWCSTPAACPAGHSSWEHFSLSAETPQRPLCWEYSALCLASSGLQLCVPFKPWCQAKTSCWFRATTISSCFLYLITSFHTGQ